jgi:hypothetical protein
MLAVALTAISTGKEVIFSTNNSGDVGYLMLVTK